VAAAAMMTYLKIKKIRTLAMKEKQKLPVAVKTPVLVRIHPIK
jgi:hypothetical protein